jgi:hypothetical protein
LFADLLAELFAQAAARTTPFVFVEDIHAALAAQLGIEAVATMATPLLWLGVNRRGR